MKYARITFMGGIIILLAVIGLTATQKRAAPQPAASPESQSLLTYRDDTLGFAVRYNPSLISFEENFLITPVTRPWICVPSGHLPQGDKVMKFLSGEYLTSQPVPTETCRKPSFLEFINYSVSRGVQTIVQSASQTNVVILRSQTPTTNALSGETRNRDTYRIFVETPAAWKKAWVLDLYLVPRKGTLLCKDKVCDIGEESPENPSYCKADCPNGKDWGAILKETFETLKFIP